jgi:hypothetical protein
MTFFLANLIIIVLVIGILAGAAYFGGMEESPGVFFTTSPGSLNLLNRNREIPFPAQGKPGTSQDLS